MKIILVATNRGKYLSGINTRMTDQLTESTISVKVERALREIGLTEYESLAYVALVNSGELTAGMISRSTSIPYSKVYSVLDSLEEKGWIEARGGRPRRYYPKAPVEALRAERLRQESKFEQYQELIVAELQPIYEQRRIKEKPEIWIVRGGANIASSISDIIGRTRREIMVALPKIQMELFQMVLPTLKQLRDKKVEILLLTTVDSLQYVDRFMPHLANVRVREEMFGGGIVADGRESLLFLGEGAGDKQALAILSDHVGLTMIAKIYFEHLWSTAKPHSEF